MSKTLYLTLKHAEWVKKELNYLEAAGIIVRSVSPWASPSKPYVLLMDASKYAWSCILTQEYTHEIDGKTVKILLPISYQSGLFKGSKLNWACLTKESMLFICPLKNLTTIWLMQTSY